MRSMPSTRKRRRATELTPTPANAESAKTLTLLKAKCSYAKSVKRKRGSLRRSRKTLKSSSNPPTVTSRWLECMEEMPTCRKPALVSSTTRTVSSLVTSPRTLQCLSPRNSLSLVLGNWLLLLTKLLDSTSTDKDPSTTASMTPCLLAVPKPLTSPTGGTWTTLTTSRKRSPTSEGRSRRRPARSA